MITDLVVRDYQSLRQARLRLGRFTLVLGPTGSGKSSSVRAVRHLAFNTRGTPYIRQGASKCIVGLASLDEGWAVSLTRGGRGEDAYRVSTPGPDGGDPRISTYTKLGGAVPGEVAELLRLSGLNFAGQFDGPFLLTESPGEVARTLGSLTNVTLIFGAAREAARRKRGLAADLRAAEAEVERLKREAKRFTGLKGRMDAIKSAAEALTALQGVEGRRERLGELYGRYRTAQVGLAAVALPPEPPGLSGVEAAVARAARLLELLSAYDGALEDMQGAEADAGNWGAKAAECDKAYQDSLVAAGRCPVCGQQVEGQ